MLPEENDMPSINVPKNSEPSERVKLVEKGLKGERRAMWNAWRNGLCAMGGFWMAGHDTGMWAYLGVGLCAWGVASQLHTMRVLKRMHIAALAVLKEADNA
jgi:hypothetical protein